MPIFDVNPDITNANTLPSEFYINPEYFELSKERIFGRTWQFAGTLGEIDNLKPLILLSGFLDEPVLLVRENATVRAVSNVCTHRGKILIEEPCSANLIRCGYHGRRFSISGQFLSMPEFDGVENFPCEADNLSRIPVETWGKFVFVSPDPIAPLTDFLTVPPPELESVELPTLEPAIQKDYFVKAHWALYCENYLEGFHIPFVHHSLNEILDYGSYKTQIFRYSSLQTAFDDLGGIAARYLFMFPNVMFNFYPWGVSLNIVKPVTPDSCQVTFLTFVSDKSKLNSGAGADLHRVELEDEAIVESVQQGIRSRYFDRGRYSPSREQGTHHFHRLIAEFMQ